MMDTSWPTARLGWTDMHLTRVGFGVWAIGGGGWAYTWGCQDDAESIAAIRYAVESGVNWIDTAAVYGLGHSEEVVAAALAGIPEADRPMSSPRAAWSGTRLTAPRRRGEPAPRPACGPRWRRRCAACRWGYRGRSSCCLCVSRPTA
jgi:Aldo/keto reductase family